MKLYHNPRCSKSRKALELLSSQNVKFEIVKYLEVGILQKDLEYILKNLKFDKNSIVRKNEQTFKDLNIDVNETSIDQLIKFIVENPIIIERPLAIKYQGDELNDAIIGRPPEMLLKLLN
ncbi:arsenate reductase (glutaredoxin) [Alphaproteobacteria bacterium]|nr:arsenate reductase (glutaredoxin) [Alphaproteobacteria bacterium]MDC0969654.1 arsenate reductase (glutaredoxin) [Alphaproteobacteria bacterium]